ncbi:hypothetical protein EDD16DRAFT_1707496 [Pisolithus croceorrhizus]|nr:hypothetical protein EDD16DRAFT_1707496 [Pisolithus croceorrhizus]KAI6160133.1 hypothetical protein EDD17DRAFT_1761684 [Pisolithus thermaeus]
MLFSPLSPPSSPIPSSHLSTDTPSPLWPVPQPGKLHHGTPIHSLPTPPHPSSPNRHSLSLAACAPARRVTGGHAPRVKLEILQKKRGKARLAAQKLAAQQPSKPSPKTESTTNSFCVMCRDGVPEDSMDKVQGGDVQFQCVTCHWQKNKGAPKPYFAFYSKGEPLLPSSPLLIGGFQHSMTSHVAYLPTALLHLHLEALEVAHSQVNMLHSFLQSYFPWGSYNFSQLGFNLGTPESMELYEKAASDWARTLSHIPG